MVVPVEKGEAAVIMMIRIMRVSDSGFAGLFWLNN